MCEWVCVRKSASQTGGSGLDTSSPPIPPQSGDVTLYQREGGVLPEKKLSAGRNPVTTSHTPPLDSDRHSQQLGPTDPKAAHRRIRIKGHGCRRWGGVGSQSGGRRRVEGVGGRGNGRFREVDCLLAAGHRSGGIRRGGMHSPLAVSSPRPWVVAAVARAPHRPAKRAPGPHATLREGVPGRGGFGPPGR